MLISATVAATGCTSTGGDAIRATTAESTRTSAAASTDPKQSTSSATAAVSIPAVSTAPAGTTQSTFPAPVPGTGSGLLWTQNAAKPLGQPVAVGDGVAVYALRGAALSIEVLDAATGRIRWQQLAATGAAAAGIQITPAIYDGHVVYLRPVQGSMLHTTIVVADAVTGRDIAVSQRDYRVGSRPIGCGSQVCFSVYAGTDQQAVQMDPASGAVTSAGAGTGGRSIGPEGLESVQEPQQPEILSRVVDRKAVWTAPITTGSEPAIPRTADGCSTPCRSRT